MDNDKKIFCYVFFLMQVKKKLSIYRIQNFWSLPEKLDLHIYLVLKVLSPIAQPLGPAGEPVVHI